MFDEQVVRLKKIEEVAKQFVRVRLARIEGIDLNLFEFDLDLTMMIFFISPNEQIYGRYGGRDSKGADSRQSIPGLRYAMQAALATHREQAKSPVKIDKQEPVTIKDYA